MSVNGELIFLWFCLIGAAVLSKAEEEDVAEAFKKEEIASGDTSQKADVLSMPPTAALKVEYPGGLTVSLNASLTPADLASPPNVIWDTADSSQLYTLAMVDPDARSRTTHNNREWLHWLVVNIPGTAVADGKVYAEYNGPAPPPGTGPHRYVLLAYKQPSGAIDDPDFPRKSRARWSVEDFAKKHEFGAPVAGIFFQAENSDGGGGKGTIAAASSGVKTEQ